MSTTSADAMSTDEAMEISKKIDEEVEKENSKEEFKLNKLLCWEGMIHYPL